MINDNCWVQTFSGKAIHPMDPQPEEIDIEDIAHALGMMCRFNGHCRYFYSVAQHCVLGVDAIRLAEGDLQLQKEFLLHDASEAYLCDITRPVKNHLPGYKELEHVVQRAINRKFDTWCGAHPDLHYWDSVLLHTEKRDLMEEGPAPWLDIPENMPDLPKIVSWEPHVAKRNFLRLFDELFPGQR
jgi:hypothetical protein